MPAKYVYASSDQSDPGYTQLLYEVFTVHTTGRQKGYRYFRRPRGLTYEFTLARSRAWWEQAEPARDAIWHQTLKAARAEANRLQAE